MLDNDVVDGNHVVNANETITGYYDAISIYTITHQLHDFKNGALEDKPTDTKILTVDKGSITSTNHVTRAFADVFQRLNPRQLTYPVVRQWRLFLKIILLGSRMPTRMA